MIGNFTIATILKLSETNRFMVLVSYLIATWTVVWFFLCLGVNSRFASEVLKLLVVICVAIAVLENDYEIGGSVFCSLLVHSFSSAMLGVSLSSSSCFYISKKIV